MFSINNFLGNSNIRIIVPNQAQRLEQEPFIITQVIETNQCQAICNIRLSSVICPKGSLSWMIGNITESEVKSSGELALKSFKNKSGVMNQKYEYSGNGYLVLHPVPSNLILLELKDWKREVVVKNNNLYVYHANLHQKVIPKSASSPTLMGGEGDMAVCFQGEGSVVATSIVPRENIIEAQLDNDILNIDEEYNQVIAWEPELRYLSEKTQTGKIISQYKGSGRILFAPIVSTQQI